VPKRFHINRQGIAQMTREIQREFDKHPIRVPLGADGSGAVSINRTTYNGPVVNIHGDRAQVAWHGGTIRQEQGDTAEIAPGYEGVAQAIASTLRQISAAGLDEEDEQAAVEVGEQVLQEVTRPEPDRSVVKRGVAALRGLLAPLALRVEDGVGDAVQDWARTAVTELSRTI
jgi:hypothetical protein